MKTTEPESPITGEVQPKTSPPDLGFVYGTLILPEGKASEFFSKIDFRTYKTLLN